MSTQVGHDYTISFENVSFTNAAQDIIELTAASGVPFLLSFAKITTNQTSQASVRLQMLFRTTVGSGGSAVTPRALNPAGPSASTTAARSVTTTGSAGNVIASDAWNVVVPWEWDQRPGGVLVPGGSRIAIGFMAGPGTPAVSLTAIITEYK